MQLHHRGVLIATHARRHALDKQTAAVERGRKPRPSRPSATAASVTRKVDSSGNVCFAGHQLSRRQRVSASPGPGRGRRRHRRDLDRQRAHPLPSRQARPHPRTRRSRQPGRPTTPHQRRLRIQCQPATGVATVRRVPGLDTAVTCRHHPARATPRRTDRAGRRRLLRGLRRDGHNGRGRRLRSCDPPRTRSASDSHRRRSRATPPCAGDRGAAHRADPRRGAGGEEPCRPVDARTRHPRDASRSRKGYR